MNNNEQPPINTNDPPQPTPNPYEQALKRLLATNPSDLIKLKEIVESRPSSWGSRSVAPYYNEKFGKQAQEIIERLFSDRTKDIILDASRLGIRPETLRLQFQQGWQWLREQAPDPKCREYFTALREGKMVDTMTVGPRVRIFICGQETSELMASIQTAPSINVNAWRDEFEAWIATPDKEEGSVFERKDLRLSKDQIDWALNSLAGLDCYHVLMDKPNHFKVVYFTVGNLAE